MFCLLPSSVFWDCTIIDHLLTRCWFTQLNGMHNKWPAVQMLVYLGYSRIGHESAMSKSFLCGFGQRKLAKPKK